MNDNTNPPAEPAYSAPVPEEQVVEPQEPSTEDTPEEHDHNDEAYDEAGVSEDLEGDFEAEEQNPKEDSQ